MVRFPAFTFAGFMVSMNDDPRFKSIGLEKCRQTMSSYPNGLSVKDVDFIFKNEDIGSIFFKQDCTVFFMDVEEKGMVLKHMESNEYDISRFCASYFDVRKRVEKNGGVFRDDRFFGSP